MYADESGDLRYPDFFSYRFLFVPKIPPLLCILFFCPFQAYVLRTSGRYDRRRLAYLDALAAVPDAVCVISGMSNIPGL